MHQANANPLLKKVAAVLRVPEEVFSNVEHYGNTSSASLLIAAAEWWRACTKPIAAPIVLAAFGAGFQWGAVLARRLRKTSSLPAEPSFSRFQLGPRDLMALTGDSAVYGVMSAKVYLVALGC